jgi:UrcA family protein
MKTFAAFAALAIVAAVAAPASAKTAEVRVSIAGKNSVQIENEIKTAADSVCATSGSKIVTQDCVDGALMSAHRQLASILRVRDAGKTPATETVSVVRISLKGKTQEQIHAEIRTAAQTVCKAQKPNFSVVNYSSCVADTVRAAKAQLQARVGDAA